MPEPAPASRYRFGAFEADAATGELRRGGLRVKLNAQPFQVLLMLLERPGDLVTREEISRGLWPDDTFVDSDHGVNSALNRIREALGDSASNPRFVETLARRGYRFIAPVEKIGLPDKEPAETASPEPGAGSETASVETPSAPERLVLQGILASPEDLPQTPRSIVQTLFALFQVMYLAFYIGALANLAEIEDLLSALPKPVLAFYVVLVTAAILIPVRAFLLTAFLFRAPKFRRNFLSMWPFLIVFDELWALSPFLLLHHINWGLALACTVLLVYAPFAQRSLVLMASSDPGIADPRAN
jgi:cholera toxin transcriptional activator